MPTYFRGDPEFWARTDRSTGCWIWLGPLDRDGYGYVKRNMFSWAVHRWAYTLIKGPIPGGLQIDHLCRVRACMNPDHLEAVESRENTHRSPVAPAAVNMRKTHCKRGHPLSGDNAALVPRANGRVERQCRACRAMREKAKRNMNP